MQKDPADVQTRDFTATHPVTGKSFTGRVFTGSGGAVIRQIGRETNQDGAAVLETIVSKLLVRKGVDWTNPILSEYLGLYQDSLGTFSLVWDTQARALVAHGAMFQSRSNPGAGLLAHIRTADESKGLGLGTLVTEEVTRAAFNLGAEVVMLATDDKIHRVRQGEKAAHSMYQKMGYAILAEKQLADTIDWLMVIDPMIFAQCQESKRIGGGRFPKEMPAGRLELQKTLVRQTRERLAEAGPGSRIEPVSDGDLANLFLLMNLCPPEDFRLKLSSWDIHVGPEFERTYVVSVRPAIVDRDRLEDATLVLRNGQGAVVAICAARQGLPFTRNTIHMDFYCLPQFLARNPQAVKDFVAATLSRIQQSTERPKPCRLIFSGIDPDKKALFLEAGFISTTRLQPYFGPDGNAAFAAEEFEKFIA